MIVVGHEYCWENPPGVPEDAARGVIARYARGRDYHKVVKKKLTALGRWLKGAAPAVAWRAYADTAPILERELGRRAGLGWFGKNTMLIHPRTGAPATQTGRGGRRAAVLPLQRFQGLPAVGDDIVDVLNADREPDHLRQDLSLGQLLVRLPGMGGDDGQADQRLDAA